MQIQRLDHLVLTVRDAQRSIDFYTSVLGMSEVTFGAGRKALSFGRQKINLHEAGHEVDPKAAKPTPVSADLCFISDTPMDAILAELRNLPNSPASDPVAEANHRIANNLSLLMSMVRMQAVIAARRTEPPKLVTSTIRWTLRNSRSSTQSCIALMSISV